MSARVAIALSVLLLAGCGGSGQAIASPTPTVGVTSSVPAPSVPAPSVPSPSSPTPSGSPAKFTICPNAVEAPVCPLPPGAYTAAVHDAFSFSIDEAGWQEERAVAGEFETRVILSRVDDQRQRLSFLSGETGPASPVAAVPEIVTSAGLPALKPGALKAAGSTVARYRFTVAKIPMDEEAAAVIMVAEAPVDRFATFVTIAERVLKTVKF